MLNPGSVVGEPSRRYQIVRAVGRGGPMKRALLAAVGLGLALHARVALASPTSRLVYVRGAGAESCPDEPEMRRAVATRLGYDPFRPLASTTLTAEVRRENGVFRGRVKLVDDAGVERGARELESRASDCRDLTTAMALSMSIAIDPLSMMRPSPPPEDPPPPPAADPPPEPPKVLAQPPPSEPSVDRGPAPAPAAEADPARFALAAGGHVAFGIAPSPAVGVHLSGELATRRFAAGVEGRFDASASDTTNEGGRASTSLVGGALVPCVRVPFVWACGVLLVSRVEAESILVTSPRSDAFLFLGAGARLVTAIALPQDFSLRIGGDVLAHPTPFELTVNGRRVYRSLAVSALAGIGVARNF